MERYSTVNTSNARHAHSLGVRWNSRSTAVKCWAPSTEPSPRQTAQGLHACKLCSTRASKTSSSKFLFSAIAYRQCWDGRGEPFVAMVALPPRSGWWRLILRPVHVRFADAPDTITRILIAAHNPASSRLNALPVSSLGQ